MDYGSAATTWSEDSQWADLPGLTQPAAPRRRGFFSARRSRDVSAFTMTKVSPAPAPADSSALPGELLTPAITSHLEARRTLQGVFQIMAADGEILSETYAELVSLLEAIPPRKRLPVVSPDGEGGLTLAWPAPDGGRTLVNVGDGMLNVVLRSGTPDSTYMPDVPFRGTIPSNLLAHIPE